MVLHKTRVIKLDKREKMDPLTQQNPVNVQPLTELTYQ